MEQQERYMRRALKLAQEAAEHGEVPVGCVIVLRDEMIGEGRNRREEKATQAEMEAIAQANATVGSWRLSEAELYVTLEPCPMCAGAILNGRIRRVFYGARDTAMGAVGEAVQDQVSAAMKQIMSQLGAQMQSAMAAATLSG